MLPTNKSTRYLLGRHPGHFGVVRAGLLKGVFYHEVLQGPVLWDNMVPYTTESVHFFVPMNSAIKLAG